MVANGETTQNELYGRYTYQSGNWYLQQIQQEDGTLVGNMRKVASGVHAHAVIQPFGYGSEIILSGQFAQEDKLVII